MQIHRIPRIPVFLNIQMTERNYHLIHDLAQERGTTFGRTISDLIEIGLLQLSEYRNDLTFDVTQDVTVSAHV